MNGFFRYLLTTAFVVVSCFGSVLTAGADVIVLSENFEGIPGGNYSAPAAVGDFFVQSGAAEVLDPGFFGGLCSAAGGAASCIDLDGGSGAGATFSSTAFFPVGIYDLFFDLAGSQRGDTNLTTLFFGDLIAPILLPSAAPFTTFSFLGVTVGGISTSSRIVFDNTTSADFSGNLLDNVSLVQRTPRGVPGVPEPATLLLLGAGLAAVGVSLRRRPGSATTDLG
jgi:hypothetical protein